MRAPCEHSSADIGRYTDGVDGGLCGVDWATVRMSDLAIVVGYTDPHLIMVEFDGQKCAA